MAKYDVVIIGAGPAGISAAIYTARAGLKTAIFGVLKNSNAYKAHIIENYFGFTEQITGPELMNSGKIQAEKFGTEWFEREIVDIQKKDDETFQVTDTENSKYQCKKIIICSGLGFKSSGISKEKELTGKGVSFCVVCDGPFFKDKKCAVIGSGNYAAEEAVQLTSFTNDVTILSHGRDFEFSQAMENVLKKHDIKLEKSQKIKSINGDDTVCGVEYADGTKGEFYGIFMALGIAVASDFARKLGIEQKDGYIVSDPHTGATNVPGVYAAGDCTGGNAQAAKSAGEGCNAAISVIKSLKGMKAYVDYS